METSVVVEDAHQRTESTPFTKSSGLVMIDSIYIDLSGAMDNQHGETKCRHFSIRGYAAEMRKKDPSICDPFASDTNKNKSEESASILPPLQVPEYKWWGCENCIGKIDAESTTNEAVMVPDNSGSGYASTSNCPKQQSSSHPARALADLLKVVSGSTNAGTDETHFSSVSNIKEKKDDSRPPIVAGHMVTLGKHVIEEDRRPTGDRSKSMQERPTDAPDALGLKSNGLVDYCRPSHKTGTGFRSLKPMGQISAETFQLRVPTSPGFDQRIVSMACETSKVASSDKPSGSISKNTMVSRASLSPQKDDSMSSESDEMSAGSGNHDPQPNLITPIRQKAPKVRLLTELLGPEKVTENDRVAEVGGSSSSVPVMSAELELVSVPYSDMTVQRSPKKRLGAPKGKRKMTQDREWRPLEFMYPRKPTKKARRFKEDEESTNTSYEYPESQSEEDVSAGVDTQTSVVNKYTPLMGNKNGSMGTKKKHKQDHLVGGYYPLMPEPVAEPRKNYLSSGVAADNYFRSANDAFVNSRLKPSFGSSFPRKDCERKSNFGKMRNKHNWKFSQYGQSSIQRDSTDVMEVERETVNRPSALELAARNCVELSRNGYATVHRNDKNFTSQKGDVGDLFSSQQRGTPKTDHKRKGLLCDLNEKVSHGVPTVSGMNSAAPRFENGSFSRRQHSDISDSRNGKKTSEVQDQGLDDIPMEIVELLARNQYERSHYEPEETYVFPTNSNRSTGYKNQYERSHFEPEETYVFPTSSSKNGFQALDKNGALKSLQKDNGWKHVPPRMDKAKTSEVEAPNKRNSTSCFPQIIPRMDKAKTSEVEAPNKRNSTSCFPQMSGFHSSMPPEEGNSLFSDITAFSKSQQMNPGAQLFDSGSFRNNNPQACKRKSSNDPNRYPPSRVPIVEVFNSSERRVSGWDDGMGPQVGPTRTPFLLEIPDKRKVKLSNFDKQARFQKTVGEARVDINFMNPNRISLGKERNLGSESQQNELFGRHRGIDLNAKVSGSVDLHANETIPAMQLLSLMDAGMSSSSSAFSVDGNPKLFTKPFFPCDHHPKASPSQTLGKPLFPYDRHQFKNFPGQANMVFSECLPSSSGSLTSLFRPASNPQEQGKAAAPNSFGKTGVSQTGVQKMIQNKQKGAMIQSPSPPGTMMSNPSQQKQRGGKEILIQSPSPPGTMMSPQQQQRVVNLEGGVANGTAFVEGWVSRNDTCSVNRNPADFSVPGPKNIFMINGRDLRFGRRPRGRPRLYNLDGRKLQTGVTPTDMKGKTQILPPP